MVLCTHHIADDAADSGVCATKRFDSAGVIVCFALEGSPLMFSGDTLFPGGPGNTSFEGGDFATIIDTLDRRLFTYSADTIVLPGHGNWTTIGYERPNLQEWVDRGW